MFDLDRMIRNNQDGGFNRGPYSRLSAAALRRMLNKFVGMQFLLFLRKQ